MQQVVFAAVERAIIRNAVTDRAASYFGGPFDFSKSDAIRYVSEYYLRGLRDKYSLAEVWQAVAEAIEADLSALTRNPAQRDVVRMAREDRCEDLADQAMAALDAGDPGRAAALVDEAELIDPVYLVGTAKASPRTFTWAEVRDFVAWGGQP